jgi:membrane protease YdiL (CAAX protease family)
MKNLISQEKKDKIFSTLSKPYVVLFVMLFAPLFGFIDRNLTFFFGLGIALTILWTSGKDWSLFGFTKKITLKTVLQALVLTIVIMVFTTPFEIWINLYFGEPNLSSLEDIKHNTEGYIVIMIVVWVFAAFGEELLFKGYYLKWLAELFGNSNRAWILSIIIVAIYFGVSHSYQGTSGVISIIFISLIDSMVFYWNRNNLGLLILMHGIYDTIGVTFLYLDMDNPITVWIQNALMTL